MIFRASKLMLYKSILARNNSNSSSKYIRNQFIDYFVKDHGHKLIKSSSVVPYCDPTLSFVNAGMNQVCNILLICLKSY